MEEEFGNISKEDLDNAKPIKKRKDYSSPPYDLDNIKEKADKMHQPVEAMKEMAAKMKLFLDHQIDKETKERGLVSDFTRRWIMEYSSLLEKIQKSIYGDKSTSINLHKVSHAEVGAMIRKYSPIQEEPKIVVTLDGGNEDGQKERKEKPTKEKAE